MIPRHLRTKPLASCVIVIAFLCAPHASAAPIYTAAMSCAGSVSGPGPVSISSGSLSSCVGGSSRSEGSAQASSGGVGIYVRDTHYDNSTASGAGARASVETDFMIIGPPGPVTTSLNLSLHGAVDESIANGTNGRSLSMSVSLGPYTFTGLRAVIAQIGGNTYIFSGPLGGGTVNCLTPCITPTPDVVLSANTLYKFTLSLEGSVSSAAITSGFVSALDTLYFPLDGPVFDLPGGYSAIINGLNVEGNRVVGQEDGSGGGVPEPSSYALSATGLAVLTWARRKNKKGGLG